MSHSYSTAPGLRLIPSSPPLPLSKSQPRVTAIIITYSWVRMIRMSSGGDDDDGKMERASVGHGMDAWGWVGIVLYCNNNNHCWSYFESLGLFFSWVEFFDFFLFLLK